MLKNFLNRLQATVFGGALLISGSWIISKFLGLLKQRLTYTTFGPSGADSVYAAFAIPDLLYGTLVLGSLLSAFMPVFMQTWEHDRNQALGLTRSILNVLAVTFFVLGLAMVIFAPGLVRLLVGSGMEPTTLSTTTHVMRLVAVNMLLFSLSNVFAGVLQSFRRFVAVSIAPIIYNAGIVISILWFGRSMGPVSVAYGAIVGAVIHLGIQFFSAYRAGWRLVPSIGWRHALVQRVGRLIMPRTVGQSITQLDQFVNVPIATRLGAGQLAIFRMANDIQDAPTNVVGLSMATVAFPVFVDLLAKGKREEFVKHFSRIVRQVLFIIIPLTILIIQLRAQIVRLFYGAPNVGWDVTIATAQTLGYFALSFAAQSLIPILARSFYAMQDTKTPVKVTTFSVALGIIGSIFLGRLIGVEGLALSYTISNLVNATLLIVILHRRIGQLDEPVILSATSRIIGVTILMALAVQGSKLAVDTFGISLQHGYGVLIQTIVASVTGLLSYLVFASIFRLPEMQFVRQGLSRILGRDAGNSSTPHAT